jgi:hypothetical protein
MKTSELSGAALDWAVTKCEGYDHKVTSSEWGMWGWATDWTQGGPIIEREKINHAWLTKQDLGMEPEHYCVAHSDGSYARYGPTPLIAAMRCYVASKLGDEVNVPKELA